jgi:hypothetical protein
VKNIPNGPARSGQFSNRIAASIFVALLVAASSRAGSAQATAPPLGTATDFAVLGGSTVTNTGPSIVTGDLGVSPGTAVTGFPPGTVAGGAEHSADAVALEAQSDAGIAYGKLAGQPCDRDLTGTNLGGLTLTPGVYCFSSSAALTGTLTLNAQGNDDAVWVFQIGTSLTTASNSSVTLIGGAQQCKIFWQVGSSATLGTDSRLAGSILALASITLTTDANLSGRALAQSGAVTMDSNSVALAVCAVPPPNRPTLSKSFSPATVMAGDASILTITLSNTDSAAAILSSPLVDSLPKGMTVSGSASTTCTGGTVSATIGGTSATLADGSIPAGGSCTVRVPVMAAADGSYINSLAAGALVTENGSNAAPAVATLTVTAPVSVLPSLGKAFTPATITAGGISTLTITLSNANSSAASLTAPLVDNLPTGVTVSGANTTTCGGTVSAISGSSTVTLTGGIIPASGSCTVTAIVTAPVAGSYYNTLAAGALKTSKGNNASPAIASLTVNAPVLVPPTLAKAFNPSVITSGQVSNLTITLNNANAKAATLTAPLVDNLPANMTVYGAATTTCGGTVTAVKGSSKVTQTGGSIPARGSCKITVPVTADREKCDCVNVLPIGALATSSGSNLAPAIAGLTVNPTTITTPIISKFYGPTTIKQGGATLLTINLRNSTSTADTITAPFTDTFPSGMFAAGPATNTCGGVSTAHAGGSSVTLTGGSIPANGSCAILVKVTSNKNGSYYNELTACSLHTSKGCNAYPYVAVLTVGIRVIKAFSPATISANGVSLLTITLDNPATTVARLTAPLIDTLPSGLFVSGVATTTCGGKVAAASGGSTVTLASGSTIPAAASCTVTVNVTAKNPACYYNTLPNGALQTSNGNSSASFTASVTVN